MKKENGRLKPANEEETAELKGKLFECSCGEVKSIKDVIFGAEIKCDVCGLSMIEKV